MPRDVSTRWNSTFDMLEFALLYREALDDLTGIREMKLRNCELSEQEWTIAEQLASVLKVCHCAVYFHTPWRNDFLDFQTGNTFFLWFYS